MEEKKDFSFEKTIEELTEKAIQINKYISNNCDLFKDYIIKNSERKSEKYVSISKFIKNIEILQNYIIFGKKNKREVVKIERKKGKRKLKDNDYQKSGIVIEMNKKAKHYESIFDNKKIELEPETNNKKIEIEEDNKTNNNLKNDNSEDKKNEIKIKCYVCKKEYMHNSNKKHFYNNMCEICSDLNYKKRIQLNNKKIFANKTAIVTGGRIKIGYETCLLLLRSGAIVIATSRFPNDAYKRYSNEKDFKEWKDKLDIYGVDFRSLNQVDNFLDIIIKKYKKIDILINNACQTIRRPPKFYEDLVQEEKKYNNNIKFIEGNNNQIVKMDEIIKNNSFSQVIKGTVNSSELSQIILMEDDLKETNNFPKNVYDKDHQQIDLRKNNSWTMKIEDVNPVELIEDMIINTIVPFIITQKLLPIMKKDKELSYIIQVSSMEGSFSHNKTGFHPHTNMAKAALNMLVRTTSKDLYKHYMIAMNAVDTGWINNMYPNKNNKFIEKRIIDEVDGAMRILDPIIESIEKNNILYGCFLKDYIPLKEW